MKERLKLSLIVLFGIILALACIGWSLKGGGKFLSKVKAPQMPQSTEAVSPNVFLILDPKEKTEYQGKTFTVNVLAESEEEMLAVDLFISYDPQVLELEGIKPGSFYSSPMEFSKDIDETQGKVFYAIGSLSPTSGKGILVSLIFKGKVGGKQGFVSIDEETLAPVKGEEEINIKLPEAGRYTILESTR